MPKPQKDALLNSPMFARPKVLGVSIDMSDKEKAEWEDTPFNRFKLWFKVVTQERTGVCLLSHPLVFPPMADLD
jgi:hypothetical protein